MRISQLMIAIACVSTQGLVAQTLVEEKVEAKPTGFHPSISTTYLESAADESSAYYQSVWESELVLNYQTVDSGSFLLKTGVARNLDALEERNIWSSTTLGYTSREFPLAADLDLQYSGIAVLPTNSDSREYLSYRGSLGGALGVSKTWNFGSLVKSTSLGIEGSGARHLFEYDASKLGTPNTLYELGTSLSAAVTFAKIFSVSGAYALTKTRQSNGTWNDLLYGQSLTVAAEVLKNLSLSLSETNLENRATSYDAQTARFALYDYQKTVYKAAATYTF